MISTTIVLSALIMRVKRAEEQLNLMELKTKAVMADYTLKKLIYMESSAVSLSGGVCVRKWVRL